MSFQWFSCYREKKKTKATAQQQQQKNLENVVLKCSTWRKTPARLFSVIHQKKVNYKVESNQNRKFGPH